MDEENRLVGAEDFPQWKTIGQITVDLSIASSASPKAVVKYPYNKHARDNITEY